MLLRSLLAAAILAPGLAFADCAPRSSIETHIFAGGGCLVVNTFGRDSAGLSPTLIVVVHGDISDAGRATYHAAFAEKIARPGVVAVALMRPGYSDALGRVSEGVTLGRQDNYTSAVVNAVGAAVDALRKHYRAGRIIYVGHSGGAAIGGVLIGRSPGLVDTALLVSCPCDLAAWMRARGHKWTRSLSPLDVVDRVARSTEVIALTGADDANTSPAVAESYIAALTKRSIPARFVAIEGAGHGFAGIESVVRETLEAVLAR